MAIRSVSAMRWRCFGRSEVGRKGGQNGLSRAIFSAYSTRENAGIAQLVEQLICNQQVVGSNPTAGSIVNRGSAITGEISLGHFLATYSEHPTVFCALKQPYDCID